MNIQHKHNENEALLCKDNWLQRIWNWADAHEIPDQHWVKEPSAFYTGKRGYWQGLPRTKEQLLNVEELALYNLRITDLPKELGKLTRLKKLSVVSSKISRLPPEICDLTNLEALFLDDNKLDFLPVCIGKLKNLHRLQISTNNLQLLPHAIVS